MTTVRRVLALLLAALFLLTGPTASATPEKPSAKAGHVYQNFTPQAGDPAELRRAWQRWQQQGLDHYVLRVHNSCFCVPQPPLETTVDDGEVTSVMYQDRSRELRRKGFDMDRMFLLLRDAYARADSLDVRYSTRGVPYRIAIDWELMIADEEANYSVKLHGLHG